MEEMKSGVYIRINENGCILRCEGGYTMKNIKNPEDWILIDEGTGDRYNLCQSHYFVGGLYTEDGIPKYRWDGEKVIERTAEEIEADRANPAEAEPTEDELQWQAITELEIEQMEQLQALTDLEIEVLTNE